MRSEYLMFVSQDNNNKFYRMTEKEDCFLAEWGRVGSAGQSKKYPVSEWDSLLRSKLGKGYTRVAGHGDAAVNSVAADSLAINDPDVKDLVSFLMRSARQSVVSNYSVSAADVTKKQIEVAQGLIGDINNHLALGWHTVDSLNKLLESLYRTIPRKMADTRKYFLRDGYAESYVRGLLQSEQALLDNLESQAQGGSLSGSLFGLEDLGLSIVVASRADRDLIAKSTDFKVSNQRIFQINNSATQFRFVGGKSKLLYHGSKNQNWMSLIQRGLLIRPDGVPTTGSMFGNAVYFADKAKKSIGYTSLRGSYWASGSESKGYLALFDVALGKQWKVLDGQSWSSWMSKLDQSQVSKKGFDSVFARGGVDLKNNEYMVYDTARCNIRYLIEITA